VLSDVGLLVRTALRLVVPGPDPLQRANT